MNTGDLRGYTRVEIDAPCVIDGRASGHIRNLSLGGALVSCPEVDAAIDDTLTVEIPQAVGGQPVRLVGDVVRIVDRGGDLPREYGIRLNEMEAAAFAQYFRYFDRLLTGEGGGHRQMPRLHRRIELRCRTTRAFHATMSNISRGGIGLSCTVAVAAGDPVEIEVFRERLDPEVQLAGVVTHAHDSGAGTYQVGVRFSPPSPEQDRRLETLLQTLVRGW